MKPSLISDARILELIGAYGADLAAFPEAERAGAARRIAEVPAVFAAALEEARLLDDVLGRMPDVTVSPALREALVSSAPKAKTAPVRSGTGLRRFLPGWLPAGAVASLAMGLLIGVNVSMPATVATASADDEADAVMYAALGFGDYSLMDESTQ
ncbi:MAG TPA: hypothetical protein P5341_02610 [Hyphomonas sp.]|nr:hypothetical protein [Hyphomonas sp.]